MALDKILGFFADNKEVTQLIAKSVPAIMGFHQANKSKKAIEDYQTALDDIEKSRQQIVNPYANVTNPFANMQVATKAAEMQAEQADISLANTLDNLRQTGAGGATALAQAALRSKQGITANIQQQEAQNQKLAAQGQQQMEMAKAQGEQARFNMQENRDVRDTYRLQMQMDMAQQQRAAGLATGAASLASGIGGLSTFINPEARNTGNAFNADGSVAGIDYSNSQYLNAVNPFSQSLPIYSNVQTGGQTNSVIQVDQSQNTSQTPFGVSNIPAGLPAGFDMNTRLLDPNDEAALGLTWDAAQNKYI
jgi:hypothetical protein